MRLWRPATGIVDGVREPAVAGRFYPGRPEQLASEVDEHLAAARRTLGEREALADSGRRPAVGLPSAALRTVAVVAPHAGYVYSGPTAGFAYAAVDPAAVERVVLLGPAHHVPVDGIGVSSAAFWRTPLGDVPVDRGACDELGALVARVVPGDVAHAPEHSLEVQVPFLQRVLADGWRLVPLIVGSDCPSEVAAIVTWCADQPRTLVVVSTDLSHYLSYEAAVARDARTIRAVLHRDAAAIGASDACGRFPLRGLVTAAADHSWAVRLLDARNSGDTAGDRSRVVGYASFVVTAPDDPGGPKSRAAAQQPAERSAPTDPGTAAPTDAPPDAARDARPHAPRAAPGGAPPGVSADPAAQSADPATSGRFSVTSGRISPEARAVLLSLARRTIDEALAGGGRRPTVDDGAWSDLDPVLTEPRAAFVTLRTRAGELLGCIGSLTARLPLAADVVERAYDAAFRDPRFPALTPQRAQDAVIDISVLSPTRVLPCASFEDLRSRIEPGMGVVVDAGRHHATFLPAVWEQLPDVPGFLAALWRKAGLTPGEWPDGTRIYVYDSEEFAEARPDG